MNKIQATENKISETKSVYEQIKGETILNMQ